MKRGGESWPAERDMKKGKCFGYNKITTLQCVGSRAQDAGCWKS